MTQVKNLQGLNVDQINRELSLGARFVMFPFCISVFVVTLRLNSDIYFIRQGESRLRFGVGFALLTLVMGWWGIPWGPIYTISSLYHHIRGGKDVTEEVLAMFNAPVPPPA